MGVNVYLYGPERAPQVNFGISKSKGEYVYRIDSEFLLEKTVVEEAIAKCLFGYDAVIIHNQSDPSISFWSKVRWLERECYKFDELHVGARFFKKESFEKVGGFDEKIIAGEDYDLHNKFLKKGYKITRIKSKEIQYWGTE